MNHDLVQKIRKCLRLAKTDGPEAQIAAERAEHLMQRHGLTVTLDDRVRIQIPGAAKVFWREQLLIAVARTHACKIMQSTREDIPVAVLVGERPLIDDAHELYGRLCVELIMKCNGAWREFMPSLVPNMNTRFYEDENDDRDDYDALSDAVVQGGDYLSRDDLERLSGESFDPPDDSWRDYLGEDRIRTSFRETLANRIKQRLLGQTIEPSPPRPKIDIKHPEVCAAFFRVYLDSAAIAAGKKLGTGPKEPERPPPEGSNIPKREKVSEMEAENEEVMAGLEKLADLIGKDRARSLQQNAQRDGVYAGREAYITPRTRKMLAADGSIPKPIPTRFTYLDLD